MIAGTGHLIGFYDIMNGRKSTTSVRCQSNSGSLLVIDGTNFLNCISKDEALNEKFKNLTME